MTRILENKPVLHWPTLNTVIMVERTLATMDESLVTLAQLKKILPRKVNHATLKLILTYLNESNKIAISIDGISWIHNTNTKLRNVISTSLELR